MQLGGKARQTRYRSLSRTYIIYKNILFVTDISLDIFNYFILIATSQELSGIKYALVCNLNSGM